MDEVQLGLLSDLPPDYAAIEVNDAIREAEAKLIAKLKGVIREGADSDPTIGPLLRRVEQIPLCAPSVLGRGGFELDKGLFLILPKTNSPYESMEAF